MYTFRYSSLYLEFENNCLHILVHFYSPPTIKGTWKRTRSQKTPSPYLDYQPFSWRISISYLSFPISGTLFIVHDHSSVNKSLGLRAFGVGTHFLKHFLQPLLLSSHRVSSFGVLSTIMLGKKGFANILKQEIFSGSPIHQPEVCSNCPVINYMMGFIVKEVQVCIVFPYLTQGIHSSA